MANPTEYVAYNATSYLYIDNPGDAPVGYTVLTWSEWLAYLAAIPTPTPSYTVELSSGDNNNVPPLINSFQAMELSTTSSSSRVTGFDATGIADGTKLYVRNISAKNVKIINNSSNSLSANRLLIGSDITLKTDESRTFIYLKGYWRL